MELNEQDEDKAVRIATERLTEDFDQVPRSRIEATVRRRVRELCARSRVGSFVGILAEREARTELADQMARSSDRQSEDRQT